MRGTQKSWKQFLKLCKIFGTSESELNQLFEIFLTHAEREDIAKRYDIIKALLEDKEPQRDLSEHLNVSIAKITRGSNLLKTMSKIHLKKLQKYILND